MEFWDALEDSQYLDAVASVHHGPRPICAWEIPTAEQLEEWEQTVKAKSKSDHSNLAKDPVEPLSLDWYLSSPIGFFFFSSFVKQFSQEQLHPKQPATLNGNSSSSSGQPSSQMNGSSDEPKDSTDNNNNNNQSNGSQISTLSHKYAYTRMNFLEDVLRFQRLSQSTDVSTNMKIRSKQLQLAQSLLQYLEIPESDPDTHDLLMPPMTHIREPNLQLSKTTSIAKLGLSTRAELDAAFALNRDETYQSNIIGLSGPFLEELVTTIQFWLESNTRKMTEVPKGKSMPLLSGVGDHGGDGDDHQQQQQEDQHSQDSSVESDTVIHRASAPALHDNNKASIPRVTTENDGQNPRGGNATTSSTSIFQKVEAIIYESLKRDYGKLFEADSGAFIRMRNFLWFQDRRVVYEDFYVMRVLGRGGFGLVSACQKGTTGKLYAIKVMSKRRIKMKKSVQFVINERKALAAVSESPFVVNLKYSFHSEDELFLILDLMSGGDLGFHLQMKGKFGINQCLYYAARIMLGLQALHDKSYVYRDLKPENCLLTADGRVKITDLGLATKTTPQLPSGVVGTRGYWAPEMYKRDQATGRRIPYTYSVDWFSFGCCLAEFISGVNPFRSEKAYRFGIDRGEKAKDKALDCAIQNMEPDLSSEDFAPDSADLCRRLLDKDPSSRLGTHGGCEEIKAHPWFKNVDWESILTDKKRPPFVPARDVNAASQHEIGNFDDKKGGSSRTVMFDDTDEKAYEDWDWTNPKAFCSEVIEFLVHERELGRPLVPLDQEDPCCCTVL